MQDKMTKGKKIFFSIIVIMIALIGSGFCVYHYGIGIQPYYEEQMEDVTTIVGDIYWLEEGTVIEQLFNNSASYLAGVDLVLVGTGKKSEGTLYVQLCDYDRNLLAQKRNDLEDIEDGQFLQVRFPAAVDVSEHDTLVLRIFVENNNVAPGLVTVARMVGVKDSILCNIDDNVAEFNLAVNYLYGKQEYVGYSWKAYENKGALAVSILLIALLSFAVIYYIYNINNINFRDLANIWKRDAANAVEIIYNLTENKKNSRYLCYVIGAILYFAAFLGVIIFPSLTYLTYQRIARGGFLVSLFLTVFADVFLWIGRKYISRLTKQQMMLMYLIASAFFIPMFVRSLISGNNKIYGIYNWIELIILIIGLTFWGIQFIGSKLTVKFKKQLIFLLLIILSVIGLSVEQLSIVIKGDSIEYYSKIIRICQNFSFSPNDISLLKSAGHGCYSYSLFSTIGENIIPYFGLGVRIESIVIWIICIVFMWKILKGLYPDISLSILAGCVSFFAFTPLILSNIQEISVEIYGLLFFMLFIYFNMSNKHILGMFFAICFVFAKEPNILILAGYYLGFLINHVIDCVKGKKQGFFEKNFVLSSISIYIAAIVFFLYFAVDVTWGINSSFDYSDVVQGNTFGLNGVLIVSKLKQFFVLNFAWLPFVAIVLGYIWCKFWRKKSKYKNNLFLALFLSYLCFLAAQLFYLTFVLPRYIMLQYFYLMIILAFVLETLSMNEKVLRWIMVGSTCIILCQNFYNIDVVSYLAFDTFRTGNGRMIFDNPLYVGIHNEFITYKDGDVPYVQPYGMTNRQFSYFDKLLEKAVREIDYKAGDLIILPRCFEAYSDNFYWGNHLETYFWDTKNKHFVQLVNEYAPASNDIVKLNVAQVSKEFIFMEFAGYQRVFYLDFSFSDDIDEFVQDYYKTEMVDNLEYRGWTMGIYQIERKNQNESKQK